MRFSSISSWLWRKGSKRDAVEEDKNTGTQSKERKEAEGTGMELANVFAPASSSASSSALLQEAVDWSIGWYEPHGPGFCSDDSFAVLVPCYASPPPPHPGAPPSLSESQLWANVLSKVAMETKAEASKNPPQ